MSDDYSAHLIAARKALAEAERAAALQQWVLAELAFDDAAECCHEASTAVEAIALDNQWKRSAK